MPLTEIVKLRCNAGCLLAVPLDDVEVRQDVEADLDEELEAEQGEDGEINIGELRSEGPTLQDVRHRASL